MNRRTWIGTCVAGAFALTTGLTAQQPPPPATQTQPPPAPFSMASKNITVTGCLQRSDTAAATTGTTGTSGSRSDDTKFVLKNASMGTTGTTGTAGAASAGVSEYRLDTDDAKLTPHVGHKVEITGSLDQASSTAPSGAASARPMSPKLKVDAVKMIAATCP